MSEKKNENGSAATDAKATRHRSPNYPAFNLEKAVERVQRLYEHYKQAAVPVNLVISHLGYKPQSSGGQQAVAALKAYGLIEIQGEGKDRKAKVTEAGRRIVANAQDRQSLIKVAALAPTMHAELWDRYKDGDFPTDDIIRHYLLFDREKGKFNDDTVDSFISGFRESLVYAGLLENGTIGESAESDGHENTGASGETAVAVGDMIQWTSQGVDQFPRPRRVLGFSDDRKWAFVEGTGTGLPVEQLTVMAKNQQTPPPPPSVNAATAPPNPFKGGSETPTFGYRDLPVTLPSLEIATLRVPVPMTDEDFDALTASLTAMRKKLVQPNARAKSPEETQKEQYMKNMGHSSG